MLGIYAFFKERYGFSKEDVDKLDAKVVQKVLLFHRIKDEMSEMKSVRRNNNAGV